MRTDVLGVGFDDLTMDEAIQKALQLINRGKPSYVVTPNPEIVWLCRNDHTLRTAVTEADMVLPDGIGVIYGAKILGRPLKGKLGGTDFASKLFEKLAELGKSVYLFGAKPGVADLAADNLKKKYRGLVIAGTSDGYNKDDRTIVDKINVAMPDFLIVGLGAPKQEYWMAAHIKELNVGLMAGLGGSIDIFAGTVMRAPLSWQKLHLEWLFRLLKQPRRITRMIKLPLYLIAVIGQRIRGK